MVNVWSRVIPVKDHAGAILTKILPGDHEYPFEFELPGHLLESVEGVPNDEHNRKYHITAYCPMGMMRGDLRAKEKIRIVRTLGGGMDMEQYSIAQVR